MFSLPSKLCPIFTKLPEILRSPFKLNILLESPTANSSEIGLQVDKVIGDIPADDVVILTSKSGHIERLQQKYITGLERKVAVLEAELNSKVCYILEHL